MTAPYETPSAKTKEEKDKEKKELEKKGWLSTLFGYLDGEDEETPASAGEGTAAPSNAKGALDSAWEWVDDKATKGMDWVEDRATEGVDWAGEQATGLKNKWDISTGNKPDFEKYKGHKDAPMSVIDQRILHDEWLRRKEAGTLGTFDPQSLTPERREEIRKSLKDDTADAYLDKDFQESIVQPYATDREKSMAEAERLEKKTAWDQATADAIRAVTAPREREILRTSNFSGGVKADLAGMQGVLSSRGNPLASQNLKLTA